MKTPSHEEASALALVPLALTAEEIRMVMRYRATALVWRADIIDFANTVAKMFPLEPHTPPTGIRLVTLADKGDSK